MVVRVFNPSYGKIETDKSSQSRLLGKLQACDKLSQTKDAQQVRGTTFKGLHTEYRHTHTPKILPGMVPNAYNPNTQKAEVEGLP